MDKLREASLRLKPEKSGDILELENSLDSEPEVDSSLASSSALRNNFETISKSEPHEESRSPSESGPKNRSNNASGNHSETVSNIQSMHEFANVSVSASSRGSKAEFGKESVNNSDKGVGDMADSVPPSPERPRPTRPFSSRTGIHFAPNSTKTGTNFLRSDFLRKHQGFVIASAIVSAVLVAGFAVNEFCSHGNSISISPDINIESGKFVLSNPTNPSVESMLTRLDTVQKILYDPLKSIQYAAALDRSASKIIDTPNDILIQERQSKTVEQYAVDKANETLIEQTRKFLLARGPAVIPHLVNWIKNADDDPNAKRGSRAICREVLISFGFKNSDAVFNALRRHLNPVSRADLVEVLIADAQNSLNRIGVLMMSADRRNQEFGLTLLQDMIRARNERGQRVFVYESSADSVTEFEPGGENIPQIGHAAYLPAPCAALIAARLTAVGVPLNAQELNIDPQGSMELREKQKALIEALGLASPSEPETVQMLVRCVEQDIPELQAGAVKALTRIAFKESAPAHGNIGTFSKHQFIEARLSQVRNILERKESWDRDPTRYDLYESFESVLSIERPYLRSHVLPLLNQTSAFHIPSVQETAVETAQLIDPSMAIDAIDAIRHEAEFGHPARTGKIPYLLARFDTRYDQRASPALIECLSLPPKNESSSASCVTAAETLIKLGARVTPYRARLEALTHSFNWRAGSLARLVLKNLDRTENVIQCGKRVVGSGT